MGDVSKQPEDGFGADPVKSRLAATTADLVRDLCTLITDIHEDSVGVRLFQRLEIDLPCVGRQHVGFVQHRDAAAAQDWEGFGCDDNLASGVNTGLGDSVLSGSGVNLLEVR